MIPVIQNHQSTGRGAADEYQGQEIDDDRGADPGHPRARFSVEEGRGYCRDADEGDVAIAGRLKRPGLLDEKFAALLP